MIGRELIQFILENSLEDEEVVVLDGSNETTEAEQFSITAVGVGESDTGDNVTELTAGE